MVYKIVSINEWLYSDTQVAETDSNEINVGAARGTYAACQVFFSSVCPGELIHWEYSTHPSGVNWEMPEVYQLIDIPVDKNTGPVAMAVKEGESAEGYTSRIAPFRVYDAMKPLTENTYTRGQTEAFYVCWKIPKDAQPGLYTGMLTFQLGAVVYTIPVVQKVYSACIPVKETLAITNWFSLPNMATRHNLEMWSEEHWTMIKRYGELMRRSRQTHFLLPMELIEVNKTESGPYTFVFDRAERLIRLFLDLGFTCIEGGHVGAKERMHQHPYCVLFNDGTTRATSPEGYAFLAQFLTAWRIFLQRNGWLDKTIQHIADEPNVNTEADYRVLSSIIRKYLPGIPLIDALSSYKLGGAVDIWVPTNKDYQENREGFESLRKLGDTLWFYTCCTPGGYYLNRFMDIPLLKTRLLHWGNFIYNLEGFLHWGLNYYEDAQDPFKESSPVHRKGFSGTGILPPGDTHIVYPGPEGPWGSIRLEAMRAGAEDYELLTLLKSENEKTAENICRECITNFHEVNVDSLNFENAHRRLLTEVSLIQSL